MTRSATDILHDDVLGGTHHNDWGGVLICLAVSVPNRSFVQTRRPFDRAHFRRLD